MVFWEGSTLQLLLAGRQVCPHVEEMGDEGLAVALSRDPWYKADVHVINIEPTNAKPHLQPLNK